MFADKLTEYNFFGERTRHLTERRQTATQTYLAVNTAIFGMAAFLIKDAGFRGWKLVFVVFPLFLVGSLTCLLWQKIITQFKDLIGWHYEQLREMEKDMPECYKIYTKEWEKFFIPRLGKERFGFSRLEAWLPRLLFGLYFSFLIMLILAAIWKFL